MPGLGKWGRIKPLGEKMARKTQERRKRLMEDKKDLPDIIEQRRRTNSPSSGRKGYGRSYGISPRRR
jgi:hypothetical protein